MSSRSYQPTSAPRVAMRAELNVSNTEHARLNRRGSRADAGASGRGSNCHHGDQDTDPTGRQGCTGMSTEHSSLAWYGADSIVCGLDELASHMGGRSTHMLSILDPGQPEPAALGSRSPDRVLRLRFHDAIACSPGVKLPTVDDAAAILAFGTGLGAEAQLLVHCHFGISRSTAAMAMLIAHDTGLSGDEVFARLLRIRPRAWPNSLMVSQADDLLGRKDRLMPALGRLYLHQLRRVPDIAQFMRVHRPAETSMADAAANIAS
jgi:predicted protein tyrosine phosphatase